MGHFVRHGGDVGDCFFLKKYEKGDLIAGDLLVCCFCVVDNIRFP